MKTPLKARTLDLRTFISIFHRKCSISAYHRNTDKHQIQADCSLRCSEYSATSALVVSVHLLNGGGLSSQYSQRRNWSQSAAESWTWAPTVLDRPAACTASASSLPWTGLQQTCSFLLNETRPAAGADRHRGRGSWLREEGEWMVNMDGASQTCRTLSDWTAGGQCTLTSSKT